MASICRCRSDKWTKSSLQLVYETRWKVFWLWFSAALRMWEFVFSRFWTELAPSSTRGFVFIHFLCSFPFNSPLSSSWWDDVRDWLEAFTTLMWIIEKGNRLIDLIWRANKKKIKQKANPWISQRPAVTLLMLSADAWGNFPELLCRGFKDMLFNSASVGFSCAKFNLWRFIKKK